MSSRLVKSTGEKVRVVIFPSTVIANVAATKGRGGLRFATFLACGLLAFGFDDFMLQRGHFLAHLAQLYVSGLPARLR